MHIENKNERRNTKRKREKRSVVEDANLSRCNNLKFPCENIQLS